MATRQGILTTAARYIGTTEWPPESNHVRFWVALGEGNGYGPWCFAFVNSVYEENGIKVMRREIPQPYYCPSGVRWAQKTGRWDISANCKPGDPVIFNYGKGSGPESAQHIGIIERQISPTLVQTIEGNTSPGNAGSQSNGGGVYRRVRNRSLVLGAIHMDDFFTSATNTSKGDSMTPEQAKALANAEAKAEYAVKQNVTLAQMLDYVQKQNKLIYTELKNGDAK